MLLNAIALVRRQGVAAAGLNELLERSQTARGSIYQHFPGGKEELIATSTRVIGDAMAQRIRTEADHLDPVEIVRAAVDAAVRELVDDDFELGCPIAAAASAGPDHAAAEAFASVVGSAVEGAVLQARAARSVDPLHHVAEQASDLARSQPRATD